MTIKELKQYIVDNDKVKLILEKLGCHNIQFNKDKNYYHGAFPDGDNTHGVLIFNEGRLGFMSFSRGVSLTEGKDLISLVEQINKTDFIGAVKWIYNILGLKFSIERKEEKKEKSKADELLSIFTKYIERYKQEEIEEEIRLIKESTMDSYIDILHIDWVREGIMPWTRKKFGLMYSYKYDRMIIPLRYWLTGELMGTNGRTMNPLYKELGIKKYFITKSYQKHLNLFGLWENREDIKNSKYVCVYEAEKSVLKRDSLGDGTGVALQGINISDEQVNILVGLNKEIVIMVDNDVDINQIRFLCEKFYKIRPVSYVYDRWGLLDEHDSPADACNDIYNFLFKNRVKYDEKEHEKFLQSNKK